MTEPILIGVLNDGERPSDLDAGSAASTTYSQLATDMALPIDAAIAAGRIDREVEFVHEYREGLPNGTAHAVEQAFTALVDAGVVLIVGPAIGDNAIVATPIADAKRMPTINWSASERARSDFMFHLQVGSHEDESILMARYLAGNGHQRVGVIYDKTPIGRRHLTFFENECELLGLGVSVRVSIPPLASDATAQVVTLINENVDGIVYLGLGWAGREVAKARTARNFSVPAIMNAAGMRGVEASYAHDIDGWVYPDMHSDGNETLADVRQQLGEDPPRGAALAFGYDMGQLVAEAIARAPELNRFGIRAGLEETKLIPAAEGHQGTTLGFGRWDRGALKGSYLVLRQWKDGQTVELT
ncbi:MAG: branched-chain amino acid transport system substrate-binding protein [Acidimicrobiaceae bacterium]|jgi:ABC-type branched-subunit amino acid transport system substrate-binding protein|nr:branched-chain amino acid transport system substrate-binding protein [Acidimicrobiaceae bacterium]